MNVLELAREMDYQPSWVGSTNGGEYHCPCPYCGGVDRFCIWPEEGDKGRYWCRRCCRYGDAIQFCRDFLGLSYRDACHKVGKEVLSGGHNRLSRRGGRPQVSSPVRASSQPCGAWRKRASSFIAQCHTVLQNDSTAQALLARRGIGIGVAERFGIGFNPNSVWDERSRWGLSEELGADGRPRTVWLPEGIVVPAWGIGKELPSKLKIRRSEWKIQDAYPKYVEVSGSQQQFAVYGDHSLPAVIVESELDAILIQQEASSLCCAIACGGVNKRPDRELHELLKMASGVLISLDFDKAGTAGYGFWLREYPGVKPWPVPYGKSPGDAYIKGLNLRAWIREGLGGAHDS